MTETTLTGRLRSGPPLVLDGAMGTELERRGVALPAPSWSAAALVAAPAVVRAIHRDYARAGAEALVANTFRTLRRSLPGKPPGRAAELVEVAVRAARQAVGGASATAGGRGAAPRPIFVLGSIGPLEDCYSPGLVPAAPALEREHAERAEQLARAGADGLLVETMGTRREALAATRAALATGLPVLASVVADPHGRLLDGAPLAALMPALIEAGAAALLVNCTPLATTARVVPELARLAAGIPFGVYANNGYPHPGARGERAEPAVDAATYARHAAGWLAAGARLVGGCCGTGPEHIAALRRLVDRTAGAAAPQTKGQ